MDKRANDIQVAGDHYRSPAQHWDFAVTHYGVAYLTSQVTNYVARWRAKNGMEDLHKALHYLMKLEEVLANPDGNRVTLDEFCKVNNLLPEECEVLSIMTSADITPELVQQARRAIQSLLAAEPSTSYVSQS